MKITIVLPFDETEKKVYNWANEENTIDFHTEPERANRCTLAFAATELKRYLCDLFEDIEISISSTRPSDSWAIELCTIGNDIDDCSFEIQPFQWGIKITGKSRTAVLYGAYEFLRLQGIRWYSPGQNGEYIPQDKKTLTKPKTAISHTPSIKHARGFYFESISQESEQMLFWMARNRLNLGGYSLHTRALARKLGMQIEVGGHIFEKMLEPDRMTDEGKTLWQAHPEWYGKNPDGKQSKETALQTQFCVSQKSLRGFISKNIIELLKTKWKQADLLDIWGFDTWGNTCNCPDCKKLGNSSDQILFLVSSIRSAIDTAVEQKVLSHNVKLVICAYEGTCTIEAPTNPIAQNIIEAGDMIVYYPINRCYAHNINDPSCTNNRNYFQKLQSWANISPKINIMMGEYYNVSRFEDLPLLFTKRIINDIKCYHRLGVASQTYMHVPMVNWAVRTLTQNLYAQLCWEAETDTDCFLEQYFSNWYGPYREKMKTAYELIEKAFVYISDWRAWGQYSTLERLRQWNGKPSDKHLFESPPHSHFADPGQAIESGNNSIALLNQAMDIIENTLENVKYQTLPKYDTDIKAAVNPLELKKSQQQNEYDQRIREDRRMLIYGLDSFSILVEMVSYHNALHLQNEDIAEKQWQKIEKLSEKLDSYYVPIQYEWPGAGIVSNDALTRTQLRELISRCRKYR